MEPRGGRQALGYIQILMHTKKNWFGRTALFGAVAVAALMAAFLPAQDTNTGTKTNSPAAAGGAKTNALSHTLAATEAGAAWDELRDAISTRPTPPDVWMLKEPTPEEQMRFVLPYVLAIADKCRDFYSRFPNDTNEIGARLSEFGALKFVVEEADATNQQARLDAAEKAILADPKLPEDERFELRHLAVQKAVEDKESQGDAAQLAEFEKGIRMLQKEFPKRPEIFEMLLNLAQSSDPEKSRDLLKEIAAGDAPAELKDAAASLQKQVDRVGKPLALKFAAIDGREVDLDKMRGKVVLVDFWETSSEPSVDMLPMLKTAYEKFHAKGFEIAGINLDEDKESLTNFVAEQKLEWPQFFDGKALETKYAADFGLKERDIPALWLVDKKGVLRYINAGFDFDKKLERLLGE